MRGNDLADPSAYRGLILSESRILRLFSFFLFYFGQGLPVGLTVVALPAWVAVNGGSSADVASIVAVAYLPWSWKFIIAAIVDRYAYLPMGRRRAWLIFAQVLMSAGFIGAAVLAPGPDDVETLLVVTFLVMGGAATQDVAVDGLAVDTLPEREQGTASAFMFGGQTVGRAMAGAASGAGLELLGPATTFLLFIPVLMVPTVYAILIRENPGEKMLPWTKGRPSEKVLARHTDQWLGREGLLWVTLKSLFRGSSLWFVVSQSAMRTAEGILLPLWPLLASTFLMVGTAQYTSMVSTVDLIVAIAALGIGSFLTLKLGAKHAVVLVCTLNVALISFLLLAQDQWTQWPVFIGATAVWSLLIILSSISTNPLRMQLSDRRVSATQFTVYNSIANFPVSLGAMVFAWFGGIDEHRQALMGAMIIFVIAGACFALLRMPRQSEETDPQPRLA